MTWNREQARAATRLLELMDWDVADTTSLVIFAREMRGLLGLESEQDGRNGITGQGCSANGFARHDGERHEAVRIFQEKQDVGFDQEGSGGDGDLAGRPEDHGHGG